MKKKVIIIILLVLVTLGVSIYTGYNFMTSKKTNQKIEDIKDIKEENNSEKEQTSNPEIEEKVEEEVVIENKETAKEVTKEKKEEKKITTNNEKQTKKEENSSKIAEPVEKVEETTTKPLKKSISRKYEYEKGEKEDYKYGIKRTFVKKVFVTTYNDGTEDRVVDYEYYEYDRSNYSATTNDLKSEASSVVSKNSGIYNAVLNSTNNYRAEVGANPLVLDNNLTLAATIRAMEMAYSDKMSHKRPNGSTCFSACFDLGFYCFAENIAAKYSSADAVTKGWRESSGHYANMVNTEYTKLGVGMYQDGGSKYWVQLFA